MGATCTAVGRGHEETEDGAAVVGELEHLVAVLDVPGDDGEVIRAGKEDVRLEAGVVLVGVEQTSGRGYIMTEGRETLPDGRRVPVEFSDGRGLFAHIQQLPREGLTGIGHSYQAVFPPQNEFSLGGHEETARHGGGILYGGPWEDGSRTDQNWDGVVLVFVQTVPDRLQALFECPLVL